MVTLGWIHLIVSPISNSESTIFFNECLSLCSFFICPNWRKFVEKLVKPSDEFVTSFREQPIVSQWPNSTQVNITWSEAYVHLVKCVDYFFVKYAPTDAQRFQITKTRQKLHEKNSGNWLVLLNACNSLTKYFKYEAYASHRKRKLCKSAEIGFGKIREIISSKMIFDWF